MKHLAAYLLATLGGNESPSAADVSKILSAVGIDADSDRLNKLIESLNGKNVEELIAEGSKKLASMPAAGAAPAAAPAAGAAAGAAKQEKKEEKKPEPEEESDEDMGFGLFD